LQAVDIDGLIAKDGNMEVTQLVNEFVGDSVVAEALPVVVVAQGGESWQGNRI
jgi:hypothetical protein